MRFLVALLVLVALAATAAVAAGFDVNGGDPVRLGVVRLECPASGPPVVAATPELLAVVPTPEVVTCR